MAPTPRTARAPVTSGSHPIIVPIRSCWPTSLYSACFARFPCFERLAREHAREADLREHEPDARRRPSPARQKTKVQLEIAGRTIVSLKLTVQGHTVSTHLCAYRGPRHSLVPKESAPEPEPTTINGQINVEGFGSSALGTRSGANIVFGWRGKSVGHRKIELQR